MLRQLVLCVVLACAAVAGWIAYVPSATAMLERIGLLDLLGVEVAVARDEGAGTRFGGGPVPVVTQEVFEAALDDRITVIGDGHALRSVEVMSDAAGLVTEFAVAAGDYVEEDDLVARLDADAERIAVERARIAVAGAEDALERNERLRRSGTVSAVSARDAELALRAAELELRQAELDLAEREIRAPVSGWIGIPDVEAGARVSPQQVLTTITDRSGILVDFRVPERVVGDIGVGASFRASPLALPDLDLEGEVVAVDTVVDRASRTLRVRGLLDNAADRLRAGMAFSVILDLPGEAYPAVDPLAVQWSSEGSFVWAVADGRVSRVPVTIRQRNSDSVLVEADLVAGQLVVIEGTQTLRPGSEVEVAEPAQATLPSAAASEDT